MEFTSSKNSWKKAPSFSCERLRTTQDSLMKCSETMPRYRRMRWPGTQGKLLRSKGGACAKDELHGSGAGAGNDDDDDDDDEEEKWSGSPAPAAAPMPLVADWLRKS